MEPVNERVRTLSARVACADPTVREEAESLGAEAARALSRHEAAADWQVRESLALALDGVAAALERAGETDAVTEDTLCTLAADERAVVRRTAVGALARVATDRSAELLLSIAISAADPFERSEAARAIGARALLPAQEMRACHDREPHPHAALGWLLARARRGDPDAQHAFNQRLADDRTGEIAFHVKDHLPYLDGAWLAAGLRTWLDEPSEGLYLGHGARPESLRVCDCAVIALAERAHLPLPFEVAPRRFTDEEIAAARRAADAVLAAS
jgi:hypothetical protein